MRISNCHEIRNFSRNFDNPAATGPGPGSFLTQTTRSGAPETSTQRKPGGISTNVVPEQTGPLRLGEEHRWAGTAPSLQHRRHPLLLSCLRTHGTQLTRRAAKKFRMALRSWTRSAEFSAIERWPVRSEDVVGRARDPSFGTGPYAGGARRKRRKRRKRSDVVVFVLGAREVPTLAHPPFLLRPCPVPA